MNEEFCLRFNRLEPRCRPDFIMKEFHVSSLDGKTKRILNSSNMVVVGKTKYKCLRCASCCMGIAVRLPKELADEGDPCRMLKWNSCEKYEERPWFCRQFPWRKITFDYKKGSVDLLFVAAACPGQTMGDVIMEEKYREILEGIK